MNGDFETGDWTGWTYIETHDSIFQVGPVNGDMIGILYNQAYNSTASIRQENIGVGLVRPGDTIEISFEARFREDEGGFATAVLFSEVSGGGTSASEVLGGGALPLNSGWQSFTFTATAGPDVSGGLTLEIGVSTGNDPYSYGELRIDDVSVTVVPGGGQNYCDAGINSDGEQCTLSLLGTSSISDDDIELVATGVSSLSTVGLFVMGDTQAATPFGSGTLCVDPGGEFFRLNPVEFYTDQDVVSRTLQLTTRPGVSIQPGETWNFQFVYRDAGTVNLSDGLSVSFQP